MAADHRYNDLPTYNGWTNYPTWAVGMHLSNNERWHSRMLDAAWECDGDLYALEMQIEVIVRYSLVRELGASMEADLVGWSFAYTNWRELAESYAESARDIAAHEQ